MSELDFSKPGTPTDNGFTEASLPASELTSQRQVILLAGGRHVPEQLSIKLKRLLKIPADPLADVRNHARPRRVDDRRRGRRSILNRSGRRGDLDPSAIAHGLRP